MADKVPVKAGHGAQPIAPDAFAVEGGKAYLVDPIHDTIRTYRSGKYAGKLSIKGTTAIDLIAKKGQFTVLDNKSVVRNFRMARSGKLSAAGAIKVNTTPQPRARIAAVGNSLEPALTAAKLDASSGGLRAQLDDGSWVSVKPKSTRSASLSASSSDTETYQLLSNGFNVIDATGTTTHTITVEHEPVSIERLSNDDAYVYYLVCDSYYTEDSGNVYTKYVFKYTTAGAFAGVYTMAVAQSYVPNRDVVVSDGNVYQLLIDGSTAKVLRLQPDASPGGILPGAAVDVESSAPGSVSAQRFQAAKVAELEKPSTMVRAVRIANLEWKYVASKNGDKTQIKAASRDMVSQPHNLRGVTGTKTFTGYPYTWGGFDSEWNSSSKANWDNFADGLTQGRYTGNISDESDSQTFGTIGLDCSGLVSTVYKLGSKYGTQSLIDGTHFAKSSNKPTQGDIYVRKGHHVVIVMDRRLENGKYIMVVGESTTANSLDRVVHRNRAEGSFESGYITGVYQNWK